MRERRTAMHELELGQSDGECASRAGAVVGMWRTLSCGC